MVKTCPLCGTQRYNSDGSIVLEERDLANFRLWDRGIEELKAALAFAIERGWKSMTPEQRAEQMFKDLYGIPNEPLTDRERGIVADHIREAVEEVRKAEKSECEGDTNKAEWCHTCAFEAQEKARADAYEDAAKIAETLPLALGRSPTEDGLRLSIADRIRARAKEV